MKNQLPEQSKERRLIEKSKKLLFKQHIEVFLIFCPLFFLPLPFSHYFFIPGTHYFVVNLDSRVFRWPNFSMFCRKCENEYSERFRGLSMDLFIAHEDSKNSAK